MKECGEYECELGENSNFETIQKQVLQTFVILVTRN